MAVARDAVSLLEALGADDVEYRDFEATPMNSVAYSDSWSIIDAVAIATGADASGAFAVTGPAHGSLNEASFASGAQTPRNSVFRSFEKTVPDVGQIVPSAERPASIFGSRAPIFQPDAAAAAAPTPQAAAPRPVAPQPFVTSPLERAIFTPAPAPQRAAGGASAEKASGALRPEIPGFAPSEAEIAKALGLSVAAPGAAASAQPDVPQQPAPAVFSAPPRQANPAFEVPPAPVISQQVVPSSAAVRASVFARQQAPLSQPAFARAPEPAPASRSALGGVFSSGSDARIQAALHHSNPVPQAEARTASSPETATSPFSIRSAVARPEPAPRGLFRRAQESRLPAAEVAAVSAEPSLHQIFKRIAEGV